MNTLLKDRKELKRLVESYGKQDVLNFVKHLNEAFASSTISKLYNTGINKDVLNKMDIALGSITDDDIIAVINDGDNAKHSFGMKIFSECWTYRHEHEHPFYICICDKNNNIKFAMLYNERGPRGEIIYIDNDLYENIKKYSSLIVKAASSNSNQEDSKQAIAACEKLGINYQKRDLVYAANSFIQDPEKTSTRLWMLSIYLRPISNEFGSCYFIESKNKDIDKISDNSVSSAERREIIQKALTSVYDSWKRMSTYLLGKEEKDDIENIQKEYKDKIENKYKEFFEKTGLYKRCIKEIKANISNPNLDSKFLDRIKNEELNSVLPSSKFWEKTYRG